MTTYIEAVAHRFGDVASSEHLLLARGRAALHAFAELAVARRAEPLTIEASDHMLRDLGVARDDIAGGSLRDAWPFPPGAP